MTEIETVSFGSSGETVSAVGFGASGMGNEYDAVEESAAIDVARYAFERGITYFDTSAYYGRGLSEERLGRAIEPFRDEVFLATKGGRLDKDIDTGFDFGFSAIKQHCEDSLRRLGTDHVDLYQLHDIEYGDERRLVEEAIPALIELKAEGKTRLIGITGYPLPLLARIASSHDLDSVLSYCRYNLMDRSLDTQLAGVALDRGLALINASILHMGLLTPRGPQPWHPAPDRIKQAARRAIAAAEEFGAQISDVAVAFARANKGVSVTVLGSNRRATLDRSLAAWNEPIDDDLIAAITQAIGPDLNLSWRSGRREHYEQGALEAHPGETQR